MKDVYAKPVVIENEVRRAMGSLMPRLVLSIEMQKTIAARMRDGLAVNETFLRPVLSTDPKNKELFKLLQNGKTTIAQIDQVTNKKLAGVHGTIAEQQTQETKQDCTRIADHADTSFEASEVIAQDNIEQEEPLLPVFEAMHVAKEVMSFPKRYEVAVNSGLESRVPYKFDIAERKSIIEEAKATNFKNITVDFAAIKERKLALATNFAANRNLMTVVKDEEVDNNFTPRTPGPYKAPVNQQKFAAAA